MKTFLLYGHGSAFNHGAEAIIQTTALLLRAAFPDCPIILSTHFREHDQLFSLPVDGYLERDMKYVELDKASSAKGLYDSQIYRSTLESIDKDTVCLSVGGDNYCYPNWRRWKTIHECALSRGAKSVLWGCSVEPAFLHDDMADTLRTHHAITARESLTCSALQAGGINNVRLCPDPAFLLKPQKVPLPPQFLPGHTVGFNLSPLVVRREPIPGILMQNVRQAIVHLLTHTDLHIALIPHVVLPMDNDYALLSELYGEFSHDPRICLIDSGHSAAQYNILSPNAAPWWPPAHTPASPPILRLYLPSPLATRSRLRESQEIYSKMILF